MTIATAIWSRDRTAVVVNGATTVPWPCATWHLGVIEAWLAAGNVIAEPPGPSAAEIKATLTAAVQRHLDAEAQKLGYDNIFTAVTYADEPAVPKFQAEGVAFRIWRSAVWAHCYQVLDQVTAGERSAPTEAELLAELPVLAGV